jgi:hypothetical protein
MKFLKTVLVAGALAAASLATTTAADAATRIVVGNHNTRVVVKPIVHRAPVVYRAPIAVYGGWYADAGLYHPYAYYRANPRLRACFLVTQRGFSGHRHAQFGATMCYGKNGIRYVVPASRHIVRWL